MHSESFRGVDTLNATLCDIIGYAVVQPANSIYVQLRMGHLQHL